MSDDAHEFADDARTGQVTATGFDGWSDEIRQDFEHNAFNGQVGSRLAFENHRVRVWHITVEPGERLPAHRHVLEYFWTAMTHGRLLQRSHDGTTYVSDYEPGSTGYHELGDGEFGLHDLENVGDTTMVVTTVEFKDGPNEPLDVHETAPAE